jgi:hypothetical protein
MDVVSLEDVFEGGNFRFHSLHLRRDRDLLKICSFFPREKKITFIFKDETTIVNAIVHKLHFLIYDSDGSRVFTLPYKTYLETVITVDGDNVDYIIYKDAKEEGVFFGFEEEELKIIEKIIENFHVKAVISETLWCIENKVSRNFDVYELVLDEEEEG